MIGKRLEDLEYVDDLALLIHRLQDIRTKVEDLTVTSEREGLNKVNSDKTKMVKVLSTQAGGKNWTKPVRGSIKLSVFG